MAEAKAAGRQQGVLLWFFQRVTAVLLAYYLAIHMAIFHFISTQKITFEAVTQRIRGNPGFWAVFYAIFIPVLVFHAMNGVWMVFRDMETPDRAKKSMTVILWATGIVLTAAGYISIFKLLK